MDRYQLWFLLVQLLYNLLPLDNRIESIDAVILAAAEDPTLSVEYFAQLMRSTDRLLGR